MTLHYTEVRLLNNMKVVEAIEKLGISQPTPNAWEGERKSPSIEAYAYNMSVRIKEYP